MSASGTREKQILLPKRRAAEGVVVFPPISNYSEITHILKEAIEKVMNITYTLDGFKILRPRSLSMTAGRQGIAQEEVEVTSHLPMGVSFNVSMYFGFPYVALSYTPQEELSEDVLEPDILGAYDDHLLVAGLVLFDKWRAWGGGAADASGNARDVIPML